MSMKHVVVSTSIVLLALNAPLAAHVPDVLTRDRLWSAWTFEPLVVVSLGMALWLYARGVARVWVSAGPGRGVSRANALRSRQAVPR